MLRTTKTENGLVRGICGTDARITVYKGIPFAAPPVGENRWRAPQPAKDWEGVRNCYDFAPISMQKIPGEDPNAFYSKEWHVDPEVPMSEDCLYLNVWTPAKAADEKLPVMVWIFGGGFQEGYSYEMEFDGERIASRGVVLVTVGYRVNIFGCFAHPELTAENPEAPTNFALLDQNYALQWVQRNIAGFGGDPGNVTLFGQSAGGRSVYFHLTSPKSKGLFHRAIAQSAGVVTHAYPKPYVGGRDPLSYGEELGKRFLEEHLGVKTIEEARKLPAEFLEQKYIESKFFTQPYIDGKFMPEQPSDTVLYNRMNDVPVIFGNTTGEFAMAPASADPEVVAQWVKDNFGEYADEYQAIIEKLSAETGMDLKQAAGVNSCELCQQLGVEAVAEQGRNVRYYVFGPSIPGDDAGAFHSCELWFTFETLMRCWRPFDGHHYDLARKMCNYWTNFAKYGDPNGNDADGTPMPEWPVYTPENKYHIEFMDEVSTYTDPLAEKRAFLLKINRG